MVPIYFVTNRQSQDSQESSERFGDDIETGDARILHCGTADIDLTSDAAGLPENKLADEERVTAVRVFDRTDQDGPRRPAGSSRLIAELGEAVFAGKRDLLIYIHGYGTSFGEAMWYGGQIKLLYNRVLQQCAASIRENGGRAPKELEVLVFSWPSAGKALAYFGDFNRILTRGWHKGIAQFLTEIESLVAENLTAGFDDLVDLTEAGLVDRVAASDIDLPGRLHLMAQSMGARILGQGLMEFASARSVDNPTQLFQTALFTGADVDTDVFEIGKPLHLMPRLADRVAVYHNERDWLGGFSSLLQWRRRMSRHGVADPAAVPRVSDIDVTTVAGGDADPFGHYYARMNDRVISDILHVMGDTPRRRIPGRETDNHRNAFLLAP